MGISNLITNKKPIYIDDLKEDDYEAIPYETGDNLGHIIAMMYIASVFYK